MKHRYFARGKLLLTSEYVILDGVPGIALPTKSGQQMEVNNINSEEIQWKSFAPKNQMFDEPKLWFEVTFKKSTYEILKTNNINIAKTLQKVLYEANKISTLSKQTYGNSVKVTSSFPIHWGLGSSSTLISLISQWKKINPYQLLNNTFNGSGYDIACSTANSPLVYTNPKSIKFIRFEHSFLNQLYFLYLNVKQNSREGIAHYLSKKKDISVLTKIKEINHLLQQPNLTLNEFEFYLNSHESIMSSMLQIKTVKSLLFPDYKGSIKSLGAWGGDFVLITERYSMLNYFRKKGYNTLIPYRDMVCY